jgi:hypothetical protein
MTTTNGKMISGYWVGSNKPIGPLIPIVLRSSQHSAGNKALLLQHAVAKSIDADVQSVKVMLGSPNGPQLTRGPQTLHMMADVNKKQLADKALAEAWAKLEHATGTIVNVYVTQHSAADIAVDKLVSYRYVIVALEFNLMSFELRSNPKVAVAAIFLCLWRGFNYTYIGCYLKLPPALCSNKQFVLALGKVLTKLLYHVRKFVLQFASPALQTDSDVLALMQD